MKNILVAASGNVELTFLVPKDDLLTLVADTGDPTTALKRLFSWDCYDLTVAGSSFNVARSLKRAGIGKVKLLVTTGQDGWADMLHRDVVRQEIDVFPLPWRDRTNISFNLIAHGEARPRSLSLNLKGHYLPDRLLAEQRVIENEVQKTAPAYRVGTGVQVTDAPIIYTMFGEIYCDDGKLISSTHVLNPGVSLIQRNADADAELSRREWLIKLLNRTDLLVLNQYEEKQLYGGLDVSDLAALRGLLDTTRFLEVLVTRDEDGAVLYNHDKADIHIPACKVEVVDPTGAGDCFLGNYIACLARGSSKRRAMEFAAGAAALAVGRIGGSNVPTADETQAFLRSLTASADVISQPSVR